MEEFQTGYEPVIYDLFPDLKKIEWNNNGQNNVIAFVDEAWVFRFPKYEQPAKELVKEVKFLNKYGDTLGLKVPVPVRVNLDNEKGPMYSLYQQIEGAPLSKEKDRIPDQRALAIELAQFLNKLHHIPIDQQLECILGLPEDPLSEWTDFSKRIEKHLFPHMRPDAIEEVEKLFSNLINSLASTTFTPTVIHGDFGISNIITKPETGLTAGIIDFGSVVISDPAYDIASLMAVGHRGMGEEFIHLMVDAYPDILSQLERAKLYINTFALQEALFGAENKDKRAFDAGMADYI